MSGKKKRDKRKGRIPPKPRWKTESKGDVKNKREERQKKTRSKRRRQGDKKTIEKKPRAKEDEEKM